ncbi:FAD-dependent oxidoreductase [Legionella cincinnatiensis]|uniref:Pyridine nucleotide-disulfide oxidoreductase n=1 Tax=Legionella cincinnatiensis TaxID=28085 RepID=A0A378IPF3_9GAMM|nr:FAD-dependent oxidoreductase [Legionella cincinnatiensis]KTC93473.1 Pyridine nucleotide-disulfide oxidoreductase [Legionella cincinnatiensis]STX36525.1 Pyridine nucleotide-disulphide oxidoreductase [Legionella cincinnatiensis]
MQKVVVIGAGPSGLYAAIKLYQKGVRDIVVYDPRANHYTRPGHLNKTVFESAERSLNLDFGLEDKPTHIKDMERILYREAIRLGIKIENKRFVRLHEDSKNPGVVVADASGKEEIVEAEYVFEGTGKQRKVVDAVNKVDPDSPLQLTTVTELPVRNHFLAYVKMEASDFSRIQIAIERNYPQASKVEPLAYAQSIIKLRDLGWKEFQFPRLYGFTFGKDKVCLYLHAPENLTKENYDKWVQTVFDCYTSPLQMRSAWGQLIVERPAPVSYTHLPASTKPRFGTFSLTAQALQKFSYKGKNLPEVITVGDSQIDFDYSLGNGMKNGIERIDVLLHQIDISDNEICFNSAAYDERVNPYIEDHKTNLIIAANKVRLGFAEALSVARSKFELALTASKDEVEKKNIGEILKEIDARLSGNLQVSSNLDNSRMETPTKQTSKVLGFFDHSQPNEQQDTVPTPVKSFS